MLTRTRLGSMLRVPLGTSVWVPDEPEPEAARELPIDTRHAKMPASRRPPRGNSLRSALGCIRVLRGFVTRAGEKFFQRHSTLVNHCSTRCWSRPPRNPGSRNCGRPMSARRRCIRLMFRSGTAPAMGSPPTMSSERSNRHQPASLSHHGRNHFIFRPPGAWRHHGSSRHIAEGGHPFGVAGGALPVEEEGTWRDRHLLMPGLLMTPNRRR